MSQDLDIRGYASLGSDLNKQPGEISQENKQGVIADKLPELNLDMSSEDIIKLTEKWEKNWKDSDKKQQWEKQIAENEKYWLGKQHDIAQLIEGERPNTDNLIFEALETYLPQATRRNPEPIVSLDPSENDEDGNPLSPAYPKYVTKVKNILGELADKNKIRLKLKKAARHWSIFQLGVAKFGWDLDKDMPIMRIIRPQKIILDPEATIDEDGYTGGYIGEYRKLPASKILDVIGDDQSKEAEEARAKIKEKVKEDTGTEIGFIEYWTPEYMCWKLDKCLLLKKKNPHWNYDRDIQGETVDDYGNVTPTTEQQEGINHFESPSMPYRFLSIFNLGDRPIDSTSLIQQNLSNQDQINRRNQQIDKNVKDMNGGVVVSLARSGLTQAQAKGVTQALRKGGTVVIPDGSPREAIDRYPAPGLPGDVFNQLLDTRNRLRDIFGVRGSTTAGLESENTVRGKILGRGLDTDRIGGGVTEYLEQFADDAYNWFVQLLYVYDSRFQFVEGAKPPKINISVKEGSLLPKDSTSIANQALELARMNRISNIDLFKRLEYPNPEELAANVWLEVNAPQIMFKDNPMVQEALQMQQQSAQQAMQAKEEAEMTKMQMKADMDMQKERIKNRGDIAEEATESILSRQPVTPQV